MLPRPVLDTVWREWLLSEDCPDKTINVHMLEEYKYWVSLAKDFHGWLLGQNVSVRKRHNNFFLEFSDKETAMYFMLRYV